MLNIQVLKNKEKMKQKKELEKCGNSFVCLVKTRTKYNEISVDRESELLWDFNRDKEDVRAEFTQEGYNYWNDNSNDPTRGGFVQLPDSKAIFHTYPRNKKGEIQTFGRIKGYEKYVRPIYGYEVVIDTNNNNAIVTDPVNMGTYNFGSGINHFFEDMAPYYFYGASNQDNTNPFQRGGRNFEILNNFRNDNDTE
jgi:hypothetical protein